MGDKTYTVNVFFDISPGVGVCSSTFFDGVSAHHLTDDRRTLSLFTPNVTGGVATHTVNMDRVLYFTLKGEDTDDD